jgi:tRNA(Arg) A34 adenosine deaminase TadA
MQTPDFVLRLPDWMKTALPDISQVYQTVEDRMRLAILLSKLNVDYGTGGPFGAAVFDMATKKLLAAGVNIVVSSGCSVAHAEIMALLIAQQRLGHYDLSATGMPPCELVTSAEPCAMCFGAIPWSGVQSLVCGARAEDAQSIGFDEGPRPAEWVAALAQRGIAVTRDLCRDEARAVLYRYQQRGGEIYNPHLTKRSPVDHH